MYPRCTDNPKTFMPPAADVTMHHLYKGRFLIHKLCGVNQLETKSFRVIKNSEEVKEEKKKINYRPTIKEQNRKTYKKV